MEVRPTSLEVFLDGRLELLEPRVMQVLTALARCRGEVVARDDLIQACWDGRIVGDDAVNRCISRIRKLAQASGGFEVQTIPRVGFRLSETTAKAPKTRFDRRSWAIAAGVAALAVLAAAGWYWRDAWSGSAPGPTRVAVEPFKAIGDDPGGAGFSARLGDRLSGVLTKNVVGLSLVPAGRFGGRADLRLTGTVIREGSAWRVTTSLQETRQNVTLWTGEFQRPFAQEAGLRDEVAAAAADRVDDVIDILQQRGWKPDPPTLALYINARTAFQNATSMNRGLPRRLLEEAIGRAPDFVAAHALLAMVLTDESAGAGTERRELAERSRKEAEVAIGRDPAASGAAYDGRYILARIDAPNELAPAEDVIIEGQAKAPGFAFLHMRRCQFLAEVGRLRAALPHCQRALGLKPLAPPLGFIYADALYAAGLSERATRTFETAARFYPDHEITQRHRFEFHAFSGDPNLARAMLHDPAVGGLQLADEGVAALEAFLKARVSRAPEDIDRALAALTVAGQKRVLPVRLLVFAAATLGRVDTAFSVLGRIADQPNALAAGDLQSLLTDGPALPLQRDPRFWPLAVKAGLVAYWRTRDVWPDFCADQTLPYDCRAEAARAEVRKPGPTVG